MKHLVFISVLSAPDAAQMTDASATEREVRGAVQDHLKYAPDRRGGLGRRWSDMGQGQRPGTRIAPYTVGRQRRQDEDNGTATPINTRTDQDIPPGSFRQFLDTGAIANLSSDT